MPGIRCFPVRILQLVKKKTWFKEKTNDRLKEKIVYIYKQSRGTYGSPRIHRQLKKEGYHYNKKRIERLMKEIGLKAIQKRKFKRTTNSEHNLPLKDNLLNRYFNVKEPDRAWASDITYIPTAEGWLYLAVIIDLYSRKVVGWSMDKRMNKELVIRALEMAIKNRKPSRGLIFHSDRGSQYASYEFQKILCKRGIRSSMSRKGDCWDNAVVESFFSTIKTELIFHKKYQTRKQARRDIFEYIEIFYNRIRLHSSLDYKSPEEYENERNIFKLCV